MLGRPLLAYLLERLRDGGADEVRVVTRPEKADVVALARAAGATVVEARPPTLGASIATGLEGVADDGLVLVGFPDSLFEPHDAFARLADAVRGGAEVALGLFAVEEPWRSDVVELEPDGGLREIHVKRADPPSPWIWGCLAARARALHGVERVAEPAEHLVALARRARVVGLRLSDVYLDVGTRPALARAEAWAAGRLEDRDQSSARSRASE